eukprot:763379-Hanusia_phi.AAC.6
MERETGKTNLHFFGLRKSEEVLRLESVATSSPARVSPPQETRGSPRSPRSFPPAALCPPSGSRGFPQTRTPHSLPESPAPPPPSPPSRPRCQRTATATRPACSLSCRPHGGERSRSLSPCPGSTTTDGSHWTRPSSWSLVIVKGTGICTLCCPPPHLQQPPPSAASGCHSATPGDF